MPTKAGTAPGYGPGTRPNPNIGKICARGFHGCGQTSGTYNPVTQKQIGRKSHSKQCQELWKESGAAALQSERRCPRMTPDEMAALKKEAAGVQPQMQMQREADGPTTFSSPAPRFQPAVSPGAAAEDPVGSASGNGSQTLAAPDARLKVWAQTGDNNSLVGLPLNLCFGALGECCGTVTACSGNMYAATWTCGPYHEEHFTSKNLSLEGVLGWHLRDHAGPPAPATGTDGDADWPDWDDHRTRGKTCALLDYPSIGAKLVDFQLPIDGHEFFHGVDTDRDQRWWATVARLNDPSAASMYAPHIPSYPLPWLLTIILVTKEEMGDPSVKLPTLIVPSKKEVYDLADRFARQLCGSGRTQMGYGEQMGHQLTALEEIVQGVAATVPAAGRNATDASWLRAYVNIEALLLTLSHQFEQVNDVCAIRFFSCRS